MHVHTNKTKTFNIIHFAIHTVTVLSHLHITAFITLFQIKIKQL